jgi:hypothetical protein
VRPWWRTFWTTALLAALSLPAAAAEVDLYGTWELSVPNPRDYANPFDLQEVELGARFTAPSGATYAVTGFFDGDGNGGRDGVLWKIRFMPNEAGEWAYSYRWSDGGEAVDGRFRVGTAADPRHHGHVRVDPQFPRALVHDDGTPHYWWGANWIAADACLEADAAGEEGRRIVLDYLDLLHRYGHNGLLLKTALFPLADDKVSWDLPWARCAEWIVREAGRRGIYVQVNFFDTWSRARHRRTHVTDGSAHVFNVWEPGDEAAKENYIRTIVARFAGFYNVYWELGNEMEHTPNSAESFIHLANRDYIPWIRRSDPYGLPIGLSEEIWTRCDVDIGFLHQPAALLDLADGGHQGLLGRVWASLSHDPRPPKPVIMNELVEAGFPRMLWEDAAIRNPDYRLAYRGTFWLMFTSGGAGASQATWLNFAAPLKDAVLAVMADQQRLRTFMEALPVNVNATARDDGFVGDGPGRFLTRSLPGRVYVSYFLLGPGETAPAGALTLHLPRGPYDLAWYDPQSGIHTPPVRIQSDGTPLSVPHPAFVEDIVLQATAAPAAGP